MSRTTLKGVACLPAIGSPGHRSARTSRRGRRKCLGSRPERDSSNGAVNAELLTHADGGNPGQSPPHLHMRRARSTLGGRHTGPAHRSENRGTGRNAPFSSADDRDLRASPNQLVTGAVVNFYVHPVPAQLLITQLHVE